MIDGSFLKEYAIPLVVTVLLHAVLIVWISTDFHATSKPPIIANPTFITANLVQIKQSQQTPKIAPVKPKAEVKPKSKPQPKPKPKPDINIAKKKVAAAKKKAEAAKKKAALEKRKQQEREAEQLKKQQKQKALQAKKQREQALLDHMQDEEFFEDTAVDEATAMSYMSVIRDAIAANWNRPPSARNGMQVLLDIQLVPSGDVIQVKVAKSSGNDAFDRSAIAAVDKAERFPELQALEIRLFDRYYRHFKLLFKPEDLRL